MKSLKEKKLPIVNCHTHIFKAGHIPPLLGKTIIAWPFYYFFKTDFVIYYFRWIENQKRKKFNANNRIKKRAKLIRRFKLNNNVFYVFFKKLVSGIFFLIGSSIVITSLMSNEFNIKLQGLNYLYTKSPISLNLTKILLFISSLFLSKTFKNIILFLITKIKTLLIGNSTKDLFEKYKSLVHYSLYKEQKRIFQALKEQYSENTKFIVLPMDMEDMKAGNVNLRYNYHKQMEELSIIKNNDSKDVFLPFVFANPRRIEKEDSHLNYKQDENGKIVLENCFIKKYVEDYRFHGFKIYPALGYFPFDETLLPLWKYASDNELPIMTHCIKGTIFYRGPKKPEWYEHPVFKEFANNGEEKYAELLLPNEENIDFQTDFTHPLNYLVLLDEYLLRKWVSTLSVNTKKLFGYTNNDTPLVHNLCKLKICFAHFGGDDQWNKFLNKDFENHFKKGSNGVNLTHTKQNNFSWSKIEGHWKYTDWYTLICSMMLQYENVYADISYILHNPDIYGLLRQTLRHDDLKRKVLFGTDYYVVRNHNSEKGLQTLLKENITENEFDWISRYNPANFINNNMI